MQTKVFFVTLVSFLQVQAFYYSVLLVSDSVFGTSSFFGA